MRYKDFEDNSDFRHKGDSHGDKGHHKDPINRFFRRGDMQVILLNLLSEKAMHGYEMIKSLEEKSSGFYKPSPGSIYPTLQMLEDIGLVEVINHERKRTYSITDEGKTYLAQDKESGLRKSDIFSELKGKRCHGSGHHHNPDSEDGEIRRKAKEVTHLLFQAGHNSLKTPELKQEFIILLDKIIEDFARFVR